MKAKILSVLAIMLIGLFAISGIANADSVPVSIEKVYVDGKVVEDGDNLAIERGTEELEVEVKLEALEDSDTLKVEATVETDHDSDEATDKTEEFSMDAGDTRYETLYISLPERMEVEDEEYALRIEVSDRNSDEEVEYTTIIRVKPAKNLMKIKDVIFDPENQVKAGRALYTRVRMKNMGEETEEDVKVRVSIPELGISVSDYVDEVEEEDSVTSEDLWMRIPECAEAGEYTATVTVEFDEGDEEISENFLINIVEGDVCGLDEDKTVIAVSAEAQTVTAGETGAVYPLTISNTGNSANTYTISAEAGNWADIKISPNVAVLSAGETKVVYVYVSANEDASEGAQSFGLTIKSGDETVKEITLDANVEAGSNGWDKAKKGLEAALVVLVVLLVVIGLIVGFNRLKGKDEELQEETYY